MALAEENDAISKEDAKNSKWVKISMRKDTPTDESSVCSTPLPPMKKLDGVEPISGPKTIKSILRSKFTFKAETLKGVTINEPSSAPTKGNKSSSALRVNSAHRHLKSLGRSSSRPKNPRPSKHFFPLCIHCGFSDHISDVCVKYPVCDICRSYDHDTHGHNRIISLRRGINPRNPQHVMNSCETCGSTIHTTTDHINIEWFRRGEELQEKKAKALKSCKAESSNANRSKTPTRSGCSRHMTGVKSYLHEYVEKSRPKYDEKRGTIFNSDNGYHKKGQNPSKTGQNRAQNRKRGKVKSQPRQSQSHQVKRNKTLGTESAKTAYLQLQGLKLQLPKNKVEEPFPPNPQI
nr:hypothetical protein [Tanacetum cinerariifolium]